MMQGKGGLMEPKSGGFWDKSIFTDERQEPVFNHEGSRA
jgi:hypothetical protein